MLSNCSWYKLSRPVSRISFVFAGIYTLPAAFLFVWNNLSFHCLLKPFTSFRCDSSSFVHLASFCWFPSCLPRAVRSSILSSNIYLLYHTLYSVIFVCCVIVPTPSAVLCALFGKSPKFLAYHDILKVLVLCGYLFIRQMFVESQLCASTLLDIRDWRWTMW